MKSFFWISGIVLVLTATMFFAVRSSNVPAASFSVSAVNTQDNVEGLPAASSTALLIEYSDFECPACRTYYFAMKQIMAEFGDKIVFVYRNFPLTEIHPNSELAARAAQAAGKQGKFWEMYSLLFEKQDEWAQSQNPESLFENYAALLGISTDRFRSDLNSQEIKNLVKSERENAISLGLQGTPTFFLNGKKISNPASVEEFRSVLNTALKNRD